MKPSSWCAWPRLSLWRLPTASRCPQFVRGGHLHVFEKLLFGHSTARVHPHEDMKKTRARRATTNKNMYSVFRLFCWFRSRWMCVMFWTVICYLCVFAQFLMHPVFFTPYRQRGASSRGARCTDTAGEPRRPTLEPRRSPVTE